MRGIPPHESLQRKLLDGSLGFASGVMIAASFWSLLLPAIEMATESGTYGPVRSSTGLRGFDSFTPRLGGSAKAEALHLYS